MRLQFLGGFGRAARSLIELAEPIMGGQVVRFVLNDGLEFVDGILQVPQTLLGQAKLEI